MSIWYDAEIIWKSIENMLSGDTQEGRSDWKRNSYEAVCVPVRACVGFLTVHVGTMW